MAMNLKQLKYVLVLAKENSFSRAAEKLGISQPSLSQYIKKIESQLGVRLFDRINGEVRITDAGQIYLDAGRKIVDLEHQMENAFSDLVQHKGGTISIGISPYRSVHMMPAVLRAFDAKYPDMKLVIKERSGHELIDSAVHGEFDLCIIALPVDESIFQYEIIQKESVLLAVSKYAPMYRRLCAVDVRGDTERCQIDLKELEGEAFAVLADHMPMRQMTECLLTENNVHVREKVVVSSNEALLSIVESGVCASFIPAGVTNMINDRIAVFPIKQANVSRDIAVIYRKEQYLSKPIRDLIRILMDLNTTSSS